MVRARQVAGGPIAVRNASYASSKEILKHISELGITKVNLMYFLVRYFLVWDVCCYLFRYSSSILEYIFHSDFMYVFYSVQLHLFPYAIRLHLYPMSDYILLLLLFHHSVVTFTNFSWIPM